MAVNSPGATIPLYTAWNCSALSGDSVTDSAATMSNFGWICSTMAPAGSQAGWSFQAFAGQVAPLGMELGGANGECATYCID